MQVREMMQYSVLTATPDMSLALAWRLMEEHRIRHLPVMFDGRLTGLVTDRDIRSAVSSAPPRCTEAELTVYMGTTPVKSCMTREVITVSPDMGLSRATQKMLEGRFGCLPVLAGNRLAGILTEIDLLRGHLAGDVPIPSSKVVQDVMQDLLILLTPEDLISTAYQRMQGGIVRHLPVVDDTDRLAGVITDRDIRHTGAFRQTGGAVQALNEPFDTMTVRDLMTTQVITVRGDTSITAAAELFLTYKFGCLPVIHQDRTLAGILTVTDLLALYGQ